MANPIEYLECFGRSQFPFLRSGNEIGVDKAQSLRPGDLAVFRLGKIKACHRVLEISKGAGEEKYLTKGDANFSPDGWIPKSDILGKVILLNGRSLDSFPLRLFHRALYFHAKGIFLAHGKLKQTYLGKMIRSVVSPRTIVLFLSPWLFFSGKFNR